MSRREDLLLRGTAAAFVTGVGLGSVGTVAAISPGMRQTLRIGASKTVGNAFRGGFAAAKFGVRAAPPTGRFLGRAAVNPATRKIGGRVAGGAFLVARKFVLPVTVFFAARGAIRGIRQSDSFAEGVARGSLGAAEGALGLPSGSIVRFAKRFT